MSVVASVYLFKNHGMVRSSLIRLLCSSIEQMRVANEGREGIGGFRMQPTVPARERQPDVLRLRGVQNVLVLRPPPTMSPCQYPYQTFLPHSLPRKQRRRGRTRSGRGWAYLGHDELVDDPALAVVDCDLVSGDGGGGGRRAGRLLQLRGARPRVPRRAAPARGRGAGDPLAPPQAPDASPAATQRAWIARVQRAPARRGIRCIRNREW